MPALVSLDHWVKEREFKEGNMNGRFNFLLALFALTIGAIGTVKFTLLASAIAAMGAAVVFLTQQALYRAYAKHVVAMAALSTLKHPSSRTEDVMEGWDKSMTGGGSKVAMIGYKVPWLIFLSLLLLSYLASPISFMAPRSISDELKPEITQAVSRIRAMRCELNGLHGELRRLQLRHSYMIHDRDNRIEILKNQIEKTASSPKGTSE